MRKQQRTLQDVLAFNDYVNSLAETTNVLNEASAHLAKCDRRFRTKALTIVTNAILWVVAFMHDHLRKNY